MCIAVLSEPGSLAWAAQPGPALDGSQPARLTTGREGAPASIQSFPGTRGVSPIWSRSYKEIVVNSDFPFGIGGAPTEDGRISLPAISVWQALLLPDGRHGLLVTQRWYRSEDTSRADKLVWLPTLFTSSDGVTYHRSHLGPLIDNPVPLWAGSRRAHPNLVFDGTIGRWYLYYSGGENSRDKETLGGHRSTGVAWSDDGMRSWQEPVPNRPLLTAAHPAIQAFQPGADRIYVRRVLYNPADGGWWFLVRAQAVRDGPYVAGWLRGETPVGPWTGGSWNPTEGPVLPRADKEIFEGATYFNGSWYGLAKAGGSGPQLQLLRSTGEDFRGPYEAVGAPFGPPSSQLPIKHFTLGTCEGMGLTAFADTNFSVTAWSSVGRVVMIPNLIDLRHYADGPRVVDADRPGEPIVPVSAETRQPFAVSLAGLDGGKGAAARTSARGSSPALAPVPGYHVLRAETRGVPVVEDKRVPVGWPVFALEPGKPVRVLGATPPPPQGAEARFRLTTGVDDRIERLIAVTTGDGETLGTLDLRYAHAIETFELPLSAAQTERVAREGIVLTLRGDGPPLWFFDRATSDLRLPIEFQPHLMVAGAGVDPRVEFHRRFGSLASLQAFGWMEGCVLDGLRDLARRYPDNPRYEAARRAHWDIFRGPKGELLYETPRSVPVANEVYGIEGGLPFADLALVDPHHPWLDLFLDFTRQATRSDGSIQDHSTLSAEGSYTIAFPLAAIAKARGDAELGALAVRQLLLRRDRLWSEGEVWLRYHDGGSRTFRGWARGVAWHFLGLVRSLEVLRDVPGCDVREVEAEIRRVAAWVGPLQRADGLWPVYVGDPGSLIDTSGSAGIAAALAQGVRLGVLPERDLDRAVKAREAVMGYLTPDGILGGVAQSNRGGEALQRSDYRVLSQMAMGLLAQLIAATE